ncbi:outer membrane beta-barrel protein [Mangrovibacterium marinum]|uniref:Outer membrane protein with beta-barrel domain n=1 Tax=Mangrovibacterium marinum TaxID=1639118 RepID=A0A2T5C3T4_9BACT|nr:outer membrane beta-barrel protein [Mangrovibacterium marinum]PTN09403.1 outer membrane protein with beta-barrel domain [Mangrovibacterium marinum]
MKKNILTLIFSVFVFVASAQTEKGTFLLSGSTGLNFLAMNYKVQYDGETYDDYDLSSFSVMPSFGYFIQDNIAIGLSSTMSFETMKYEDGDKEIMNSVMMIPSAFIFFPVEGDIKPFAQAGVGYSSMTNKWEPKTGSNYEDSYGGLTINFGGGLAYFVKENISFNLGLSYTKATFKNKDDDSEKIKQGNFGANIGIAIYLK